MEHHTQSTAVDPSAFRRPPSLHRSHARSVLGCARTPFLRAGAMVLALILVTMKPFLRPTAIPDMAMCCVRVVCVRRRLSSKPRQKNLRRTIVRTTKKGTGRRFPRAEEL